MRHNLMIDNLWQKRASSSKFALLCELESHHEIDTSHAYRTISLTRLLHKLARLTPAISSVTLQCLTMYNIMI